MITEEDLICAKIHLHLKEWIVEVKSNPGQFKIPDHLIDSMPAAWDKYLQDALLRKRIRRMSKGWEYIF